MLDGISLKAACADNFYHPPNWDPQKESRNQHQGSRGANQYELYGKIRFETPWNMYCTHCNGHISQGVRYNAKKDKVGKYLNTTTFRFSFTCHLCKKPIAIETDPENRDYKCAVGCRRAQSSYVNFPKYMKKEEAPEVPKTFENVYNLPTKPGDSFADSRGPIFALSMTKNGRYLFAAGSDRLIRLYNPSSEKFPLIREFKGGHGQAVRDIAVRDDNAQFASCGGDQGVCVWDIKSQSIVRKFYGHVAKVNSICYNEQSTILASASDDCTLCLWDLKDNRGNKPLQRIKVFKNSVSSVKICDHCIITGCVDGHMRVFDLRQGKCIDDNMQHPITSLAVSGDKRCTLVSSTDNTLRLMDRSDGTMLQQYKGHRSGEDVVGMTFSNCDGFVLCGSSRGIIHMWDLVEGKQVAAIQGHPKTVTRICYHPSKAVMFTASADGVIQTWTS